MFNKPKGSDRMKAGDRVKTPRFLTVRIQEVFENEKDANTAGYVEPTHYDHDEEYDILGKHTGLNRMQFAAIRK